jgi:hypothetical protein
VCGGSINSGLNECCGYRNISLYANLSDIWFFCSVQASRNDIIIFFFTSAHVPIVLMLAVSIKGRLCIQVAGPRSGTREVIAGKFWGEARYESMRN